MVTLVTGSYSIPDLGIGGYPGATDYLFVFFFWIYFFSIILFLYVCLIEIRKVIASLEIKVWSFLISDRPSKCECLIWERSRGNKYISISYQNEDVMGNCSTLVVPEHVLEDYNSHDNGDKGRATSPGNSIKDLGVTTPRANAPEIGLPKYGVISSMSYLG